MSASQIIRSKSEIPKI